MQVQQFLLAKLLFLSAACSSLVQLNRVARRCRRALHLEQEQGISYGDLIARSKHALLHRDAIDKRSRSAAQVREQKLLLVPHDLAMPLRNGAVLDTHRIRGIAADRQRAAKPEFRLSEGPA